MVSRERLYVLIQTLKIVSRSHPLASQTHLPHIQCLQYSHHVTVHFVNVVLADTGLVQKSNMSLLPDYNVLLRRAHSNRKQFRNWVDDKCQNTTYLAISIACHPVWVPGFITCALLTVVKAIKHRQKSLVTLSSPG